MKITVQTDHNVPFQAVSYGVVFSFQGEYFMAIEGLYNQPETDSDYYNAISLHNGEPVRIDEDDFVTPVDAELIIH